MARTEPDDPDSKPEQNGLSWTRLDALDGFQLARTPPRTHPPVTRRNHPHHRTTHQKNRRLTAPGSGITRFRSDRERPPLPGATDFLRDHRRSRRRPRLPRQPW